MRKTAIILAIFLTLIGNAITSVAQEKVAVVDASYIWMPGKLIPNEFALPDGTWSNSSIRECISKCSANQSCSGFSIQKVYGEAFQSGCKDEICEQKTECHAKGTRQSSVFWLPNDTQIRVPNVNPNSNDWIEGWGTLLKNNP